MELEMEVGKSKVVGRKTGSWKGEAGRREERLRGRKGNRKVVMEAENQREAEQRGSEVGTGRNAER